MINEWEVGDRLITKTIISTWIIQSYLSINLQQQHSSNNEPISWVQFKDNADVEKVKNNLQRLLTHHSIYGSSVAIIAVKQSSNRNTTQTTGIRSEHK